MISRIFKDYDLDKMLKNFEEIFYKEGFNIVKKQKMTEKSFPEIVVITLSKDKNLFRVSFVLDKNGITLTAVGIKDEKIEKEITELLDLLRS